MTELIICEKPSAAKKIAEALADGIAKKENINSVPFYRLEHKGKEIIVGCAVGHLYTVGEIEKTPWSKFPVYEVEWVPTSQNNKSAEFSKKYLNALKKLAKESKEFTVACDYDIEGEVIGLNIVKYICKKKDANRMKFSTLTKNDLIKSYENKSKTLDWGQANAGETRHVLDFFYGINMTRALTGAINKATGGFKVLSSGRVQGPALKIVVDREKEIKAFVPEPFWQIELNGNIKSNEINALHIVDKFWKKEEADKVMENVKGHDKGKISKNEKKQFKQNPPVPFDLTSLQIEAHRLFRIKPKETLDIAQTLYTGGWISYPRTSSQKLPEQLGFKKIFEQLKMQEFYAKLSEMILKLAKLVPNEGKKKDDAHPAIYPTGIAPGDISEREFKIYDLIVKRFFSVFGEPATRETNTIIIDVNSEEFITKGTVTVEKGWHVYYVPYVKLEENELPVVNVGDEVDIEDITQLSKETQPPKRYTQASIIKALEKKNLGTKATRATIIETLFARSYVIGDNNIEATELGIKTTDTLEKYMPDILDVDLTRHFEEEMEKIRKKDLTPEQVLEEAKKIISKIIGEFKSNEKLIGEELSGANREAIEIATNVGKCPKCGKNDLIIRKGKFGKFIGCRGYPDCQTIFNIPKKGTVKPTGEVCEKCNHPVVEVKLPKKGPQKFCINQDCETRKTTDEEGTVLEEESYPEEGMECPNCGKGKMVLRKSFYGQFLGCNNYPRCKTMMKIVDGKVDTTPITPKAKKKKVKKKKAKKKKAVKKKVKNS
ncbi:DNA topoisomerase I [Nanoarchaeota archaeon]